MCFFYFYGRDWYLKLSNPTPSNPPHHHQPHSQPQTPTCMWVQMWCNKRQTTLIQTNLHDSSLIYPVWYSYVHKATIHAIATAIWLLLIVWSKESYNIRDIKISVNLTSSSLLNNNIIIKHYNVHEMSDSSWLQFLLQTTISKAAILIHNALQTNTIFDNAHKRTMSLLIFINHDSPWAPQDRDRLAPVTRVEQFRYIF